MMNLQTLLQDVEYELVNGSLNIEIADIKENSREVATNDLFIAIVGTVVNSHKFIPSAIESGATVIVVEEDVAVQGDVTVIKVPSSRKALAVMAKNYFGNPAKELCTVGITGTCGKTSVSYIIKTILEENGEKIGIIGTIGAFIDGEKTETHNTTPGPYEVQKLMRKMVDKGCTYCVMEVSSQGIKMNRVEDIVFDYGIFTNLALDHIGENEHADYEEYRHYKSLFFKQVKQGILNKDTKDADFILRQATCPVLTCSMKECADFQASQVSFVENDHFLGMEFRVGGIMDDQFLLSIPGEFSVYNALSAIALAHQLKIDAQVIKSALMKSSVLGRMEVVSSNETYKVIIDYAHNHEELCNLMETIGKYKPKRLVSIFGCGGNRAKDRRYAIGEVVGGGSDLCIITEDNPRFETFEDINEDIFVGMNRVNGTYIVIKDRQEAISHAVKHAEVGDIILLVGKGHENYQEIQGTYHFWDEREAVRIAEQ